MIRLLLSVLLLSLALAACVPAQAPLDTPIAEEPSPQVVPTSTPTPFPTPAEVAPEETFTEVGNTAVLQGSHGVQGQVVVAGLQTVIIQGFSFDGKGPSADIRLVKGQDYGSPAAVLSTLEKREYAGEFLLLTVPSTVTRENADRLVVYAPETGEVYAEAVFE